MPCQGEPRCVDGPSERGVDLLPLDCGALKVETAEVDVEVANVKALVSEAREEARCGGACKRGLS